MRIAHPIGITVLMIGVAVLTGCSNAKPGGPAAAVNMGKSSDPKTSTTIPPTSLPVLKEKLIKKEPMTINDQVALHMLSSDERQKLMSEVSKAKH